MSRLQYFVLLMIIPINSIKTMDCSNQSSFPLCFCRVFSRISPMKDFFLGQLAFVQCNRSSCRRSRFYSPNFHLQDLLPQITNHSQCFNHSHCLHLLSSKKSCRQCRWNYHNTSSMLDSCFHFCEDNPSCGILCLKQSITLMIQCRQCRERKYNLTCRYDSQSK